MKQEELQQVWQERSQEAFVQVAQWQQRIIRAPAPADIEQIMDHHVMRLRAHLIQEVAQHRDVAPDGSASSPPCPKCGTLLHARGTRKRSLQTQGDQYQGVGPRTKLKLFRLDLSDKLNP